MDVNKLFQNSGSVRKRKLEAVQDPSEIYKSAKLSASVSKSIRDNVQGEASDDINDHITGPTPSPENHGFTGDYSPEMPHDDDEGRFFGGGITHRESEILNYVDDRGEALTTPEKIDGTWLRKTSLNFEKRITKNAELRAKFAGDPRKFIESEADLDVAIKDLSIIAEHPELYRQFIKLGCVDSLVGLLAHDNTDIAIAAVEVIGELTDEDVYATDEDWDSLADALLKADVVGLLVSNFSRLNEDDESDRSGVYHALGVIENLLSKKTNSEGVGQETTLIKWLLDRAQRKESRVSQNKQYATELLDIIAHTSPSIRRKLAQLDAVDVLLQLVSVYRKRDPEKGSEEEEYMENIFNTLVCVVGEPDGKAKFVEAEGVELCLIMLKEGKLSRQPAMRLLVHGLGGDMRGEVCRKVVEAGGLKILFTLFKKTAQHRMITESLFDIFSSLLRFLPANSAERIRTLAKFVEKDYEKLNLLYEYRRKYQSMLDAVDMRIQKERIGMTPENVEQSEGEWYLERIDEGLYSVRAVDVIIAWLVAEDAGAREKARGLLGTDRKDLSAIRITLQEYRDDLSLDKPEHKDLADMLSTLVDFLN